MTRSAGRFAPCAEFLGFEQMKYLAFHVNPFWLTSGNHTNRSGEIACRIGPSIPCGNPCEMRDTKVIES